MAVATPNDAVERMSRSLRDLTRGPATTTVRELLFGAGDDALDPTQVDVLDLLVHRDDRRMNELASALRVDPSTMTRALQRMEAAGLAVRTPHDRDRRVVTVHISASGRDVHRTVLLRRRNALGDVLARFDAEDRRRLVELVERFIDLSHEHVGLPAIAGSAAAAAG